MKQMMPVRYSVITPNKWAAFSQEVKDSLILLFLSGAWTYHKSMPQIQKVIQSMDIFQCWVKMASKKAKSNQNENFPRFPQEIRYTDVDSARLLVI